MKLKTKLIDYISSYPLCNKYLSDYKFRAYVSLFLGIIVSATHVLFRLISGLYYQSIWFLTIAAYYFLLATIRFALLKKGYKLHYQGTEDIKQELKLSKRIGYFMLLLNYIIFVLVIIILKDNESYKYPGYIIYISALYSFIAFGTSIRNMFFYRKTNSPIIMTSKAIRLTEAIFSILALQTAMFSSFSVEDEIHFVYIMNLLTGIAVSILCLVISIGLILITKRTEKKVELEINKS